MKELKPPAELVEAIQNSGDMTAPPNDLTDGAGAGINVPRTIRNRLATEEPQKLNHDDDSNRNLAHDRPAGTGDKIADKMHIEELRHMQNKEQQYERHPRAGEEGRGTQALSSKANIKSFERNT